MSGKIREGLKRLAAYIFMAIFSVAAIYMAYLVVDTLVMTERARSWTPVTATLIEQKLDTIEKSFQSAGDISAPSQRLKARYSYTFEGTLYHSDRVDFSNGHADNFSAGRKAGQQKLLNQIPLTAYVDPQNPAESVIDRSLPAERMLFFTFFLLFPCGFAVYVMIGTVMLLFGRWRKLTSPLSGIFHGGMALWLLVFHHDSYGFRGTALLLLMSCLFVAGVYFLIRHDKLRDWPET